MARRNPVRGVSSPPNTPLAPSADFIDKKLEELRDFVVKQLTATEERLMQKFGELAADIANMKSTFTTIEKRVSAVENACSDVLTLRSELITAQSQINALESNVVATDLIITGIPQTANECLPELFSKICRVAEHKAPPLRDAFRLRNGGGNKQNKNNSNSTPIVVKLFSESDRNMLLKSVAVLCKSKKRSLALSDIDLAGYGSFYLHESLPKKLRLVVSCLCA